MKIKLGVPNLKGLGRKGLGRRWFKRLRGAFGWFFLASVVFVIGVWLSLPTKAIAWRVSHELKSRGHDVRIGNVSVRPWGSLKLEDVEWHFGPSKDGRPSIPLVFDQISAGGTIPLLSTLSYLFLDNIDASLDGDLDEGELDSRVIKNDDETRVEIDLSELPLYSVPKLQASLNAPLRGTFGLQVDLEAPEGKYEKANGQIKVSCLDCKIGDGDTLLFIPGVTKGLLAKGITIPEVDLGTLNGVLDVKDGKATTEEFQTDGQGVAFKISGGIELQDPIENSRFDLVLKVKINEALQAEHDNIRLMVSTATEDTKLKGADEGWLGFTLKGNLGRPKFAPFHALSKEMRLRQARERRRKRAEQARQRREERKRKSAEAKKKREDAAKLEKDKKKEEEDAQAEREAEDKRRREEDEKALAEAAERARLAAEEAAKEETQNEQEPSGEDQPTGLPEVQPQVVEEGNAPSESSGAEGGGEEE